MNLQEKEKLYIALNDLINTFNLIKKTPSRLSLTRKQFDLFKKFNNPVRKNIYVYRGIKIEPLQG